jgi:hypothetical protein
MKQFPAFVISEFTNPSGEIVFRVSGWSDGKRVRKNFATRADAEAERQVLEIQRLQAETGIRIAGTRLPGRLYGGVTWNEVVQLVHHYQAGTLDPGTFLLVRQWREAGKASPALMRVGLAFLESVLPVGKRRLLKHLNQALAFVKKYENKAERRTAVRYADWWKLNALFYILRHPRESCGTRDLRAHLAALGLDIGTRDVRRFCTRHGIKRDIQAGRPRTRIDAPAARTARPTRNRRDRKAG